MADVTGQFGDQPVELNNAATEATLKTLLAIAKVDSKNLLELARKMLGPDAANLKDFEENLEKSNAALDQSTKLENAKIVQLDDQIKKYGKINTVIGQLDVTMTKLMNGTGKASDIFNSLSQLPGALGVVASGFARFAKIQEENFETYQKISSAGVTFAGSLTDLRLAAANSYMTLDGFATLIKNNSTAFASFGGSANDGAVNFAKFSHSILKSDLGTHLLALGFTADQANQGMVTYLAAAGVSNAKDLEQNAQLREGAAAYLEEIDRLAEVTGKSREEQDEIMKKQKLDAEIQMTAARIKDPADRAKFEANVKYMTMMYGDAGKDMALAQAQHRSVVTKEGQTLMGLAPGMRAAMDKMAKAKEGTQEYIDAQNEMNLAVQQGVGKIPTAALGFVKGIDQAELTVANQTKAGLTTKEALNARDKKIADDKAARDKSQAATMAESEKAFKQLGAALWEAFSPVVSGVTIVVGWLGKLAGVLASTMTEFPMVSKGLAMLGLAVAGLVAWKVKELALERAKSVLGAVSGGAGSAAGAAGGGLGKALGGIGPGIGGILEGLANGIKAFANPQILLGAAILSGSIAIIGAGIAAATWLLGKALPTMAEGLKSFADIDGDNLVDVAKGIGALGLAFGAFGAGSALGQAGNTFSQLWGGITKMFGGNDLLGSITTTLKTLTPEIDNLTNLGNGLQKLGDGMMAYGKAVASIDIAKAERVKELMKGPSAAEQVANAGAKLFSAAADRISTAVTSSTNPEKTGSDLQALNSTMREMLKYMKDATANTERTYKVIEDKKGKVW